ncbi:NAD(P)H-binding protein [Clostridium sp. J1101437_171009_A5]|uniref:NAD(P)-dependent oxidoreductase n=1 Tax=Clostridium sp. J1101437_171009_A5 TaxID=2787098 RepID=UPI0018998EEB|nr:NAD(P)H-binding protein [Clostridium sp. J1101437_171009_A5]MBS5136450.1 SDR family NAD(P)-dependent oxidoreductase [Oscillospiraceae bacterium]
MNVIIFGATGGIGKWAVKYALQSGYHVTAYVRNAQKITQTDAHLTVIQGDIYDQQKMTKALSGQDAVVWCVGIPMKKSYQKMESLEGHKVLIQAMEANQVKRLVDWGTPSVHFEQDKKSLITVVPGIMAGLLFPQAKKEMLAIAKVLQESNLDWTLVRFMAPQNTSYTGNVKVGFGDRKMKFSISREDIGAFMIKMLDSDTYIHSMPIIGS